jgi:hypothetical protein
LVHLFLYSPIVLRPKGEEDYSVLGEIFVCGFMDYEVLMGCHSSQYKIFMKSEETSTKGYSTRYLNKTTGDIKDEDPRLGPLPPDGASKPQMEYGITSIAKKNTILIQDIAWKN